MIFGLERACSKESSAERDYAVASCPGDDVAAAGLTQNHVLQSSARRDIYCSSSNVDVSAMRISKMQICEQDMKKSRCAIARHDIAGSRTCNQNYQIDSSGCSRESDGLSSEIMNDSALGILWNDLCRDLNKGTCTSSQIVTILAHKIFSVDNFSASPKSNSPSPCAISTTDYNLNRGRNLSAASLAGYNRAMNTGTRSPTSEY